MKIKNTGKNRGHIPYFSAGARKRKGQKCKRAEAQGLKLFFPFHYVEENIIFFLVPFFL
jgi:hypothetical protein